MQVLRAFKEMQKIDVRNQNRKIKREDGKGRRKTERERKRGGGKEGERRDHSLRGIVWRQEDMGKLHGGGNIWSRL